MRKLFLFLTLFLFACTHSTPKGEIEKIEIYAYDGNGTLLGTVEDYNSTYAQVRTSKGFLDFLQYDGYPFGKGNQGPSTSPADQDWLFYIVSRNGTEYFVPPQSTKQYTKLTLVFGLTLSAIHRFCSADGKYELVEPGGLVRFYEGLSQNYAYTGGNNEATDSKDPYFQYENGNTTTTVQGYPISFTGCQTNEDIGYPQAVDGQFALKGPITLKKSDGTEVTP